MSDASDSKPDNGEAVMAEHPAPEGVVGGDGTKGESLPENAHSTSPARAGRPAGQALAWLALLLSIAALALAGGSFWSAGNEQASEPDPALAAFEARLDDLQRSLRQAADRAANAVDAETVRRLESRIASVEQSAAEPDEPVANLQQRLERAEVEFNRGLDAVRERVVETERASRSEQARIERLEQFEQQRAAAEPEPGLSAEQFSLEQAALIRIEGLLAAARDRLQLLGDLQTARQAWAEAIVRIEGLDSTEFDGLLQRLRAERDALAAASTRDHAADISALFAASNDVLRWPLSLDTGRPEAESEDNDSGTDSGWQARFGRVFERLVRVERVDIQYLDPAEIDATRQSLAALLETTALAVARRDNEVTARLAAEAQSRIRALFETGDPSISALIQRLGALSAPQTAPEPPLDASTMELRRLIEAGR